MMTDSSFDSEDDSFLLAAVALSLDFARPVIKANERRRLWNHTNPPYLFDLLGVSRPLLPLPSFTSALIGQASFLPSEIERVLTCGAYFRPTDDSPHRRATRCDS